MLLTGVLVTLLLSAFGSSSPGVGPALSPAGAHLQAGPPDVLIFARAAGALRLQLPISKERVTAVGYHGVGADGVPLAPYGRQANEGVVTRVAHSLFGGGGTSGLAYYHLGGGEGPSTGAVDIGAVVGTDVYSPVDGSVVGITDYVINGSVHGAQIEIQPNDEPSLVVAITRVRPDPALTVGSLLRARVSKVGSVLDFSAIERQALARITHEAGNHVTISVHPGATLPLH